MADRQRILHEAIEEAFHAGDVLDDGEIVTGWLLVYETTTTSDNRSSCGHLYGPEGMTTWRALGLADWARRFTLTPDEDDD